MVRRRLLVIGLVVAAACVVASVSLAASRASSPLVITFGTTAAVKASGSQIRLGGTVRCQTKRFFAFDFQSIEPSSGALAWGGYPASGAAPSEFVCNPTARRWQAVVAHPISKTALAFKPGPVRVCVLARTWGPHVHATIQPFCASVRVG